jgi:molecular chaperone GrpE
LSQDPADEPDGPTTRDAGTPPAPAEPSLEELEEAGAAEQAHQRARLAEDRLAEVLSAYRQVKTENEGFRDRVTRDVELAFDRRRERLLLKFIEILDNLDRALEAAEQTYAGNPLVEGLILVRTQLLQTLQQEGLERIPVVGLPYDPALTEAVATQPVDDPEEDHIVVRELMRGYRLNGRVARASRAVIGAYKDTGAAEADARSADLLDADAAAEAAIASLMPGDLDPAADTIPIDENMLREIFGDSIKRKPKK